LGFFEGKRWYMYFVKNCHQVLRALSEIDPTNGFEVVGEKTVGGMVFFCSSSN